MVRIKASSIIEVLVAMLIVVISFLVFSTVISSVSMFHTETQRIKSSPFVDPFFYDYQPPKQGESGNFIQVIGTQKQYDLNIILIEVGVYNGDKEIFTRKRLSYE